MRIQPIQSFVSLLLTATQPRHDDEPAEGGRPAVRHLRRVSLMLQLCCVLTILLALGWTGYFASHRLWLPMAMPLSIVLVSVACLAAVYRGHAYIAGAVQLMALYLVVSLICLVLDIPSANLPRTSHLFLLPMAAAASMVLRGGVAWFRHAVVLMCLATFVVFATTTFGLDTPYALSDSIRRVGTKFDCIFATAALFTVLYIMQADVDARNAFETDLCNAIIEGQFVLHYQPQVQADGRVIGAEALVRWQHPRRGMVAPGEFIASAEKNGLILPLGDWVLKQACTHLAAWAQEPAMAELTMSVNVSARQFRQPDFVAQVLATVERTGANPRRLKLELTESMLASNLDDVVQKMMALKARGIGFSLDDFGTGYSSLSYLQKLPLDQLKIDRAFVRDLQTQPRDMAIARTVVHLGQSLQLDVIAEGVETPAQRDALAAIGCVAYQGYLFGRPMTEAQLRRQIEQGRVVEMA